MLAGGIRSCCDRHRHFWVETATFCMKAIFHSLGAPLYVHKITLLQVSRLYVKTIGDLISAYVAFTSTKCILASPIDIEHCNRMLFVELLVYLCRDVVDARIDHIIITGALVSVCKVQDLWRRCMTYDRGPWHLTIIILALYTHNCDQRLNKLKLGEMLRRPSFFLLLDSLLKLHLWLFVIALGLLAFLLVEIYQFLQWESGAHLVSHTH